MNRGEHDEHNIDSSDDNYHDDDDYDDDDGDDGDDDDDDDDVVGRLTEGGIGRRRLVTLMAVERK